MDLEKIIAQSISVELSKKICGKITTQTERSLQRRAKGIVIAKPLKNTWDDFCYQCQREGSFSMSHSSIIKEHVGSLIERLENYEFNAIYLQIENKRTDLANTDTSMVEELDKHQSISMRMFKNELIDYIAQEYIYKRAKNFSNKSIRKALSDSDKTENS